MKYIVKSCPNLMNSIYSTGREAVNECSESVADEKCCDLTGCVQKKVVERLMKVIDENVCSRCDGCGYDGGCSDEGCGTYQAHKCLELLEVEVVPESTLDKSMKVLQEIQKQTEYLQVNAWNISEKGCEELNNILKKLYEIGKEV